MEDAYAAFIQRDGCAEVLQVPLEQAYQARMDGEAAMDVVDDQLFTISPEEHHRFLGEKLASH